LALCRAEGVSESSDSPITAPDEKKHLVVAQAEEIH